MKNNIRLLLGLLVSGCSFAAFAEGCPDGYTKYRYQSAHVNSAEIHTTMISQYGGQILDAPGSAVHGFFVDDITKRTLCVNYNDKVMIDIYNNTTSHFQGDHGSYHYSTRSKNGDSSEVYFKRSWSKLKFTKIDESYSEFTRLISNQMRDYERVIYDISLIYKKAKD